MKMQKTYYPLKDEIVFNFLFVIDQLNDKLPFAIDETTLQ